MDINIKLSHLKGSDYNINIDLDPERVEPTAQLPRNQSRKAELGAVKRPDADRLKILKNPELAAEEKDTEAVMDKLELDG